jgi:integrase
VPDNDYDLMLDVDLHESAIKKEPKPWNPDSGKELSQIAELAGHKSLQTTMKYIHQDNNQKQQIVDELAQALNL